MSYVEDLGGKAGTKFIRSRYMSLLTVLTLFVAWGACVSIILTNVKLGEKIYVYGTFQRCPPGCSDIQTAAEFFCFSGTISQGNVDMTVGDKFVCSIDDEQHHKTVFHSIDGKLLAHGSNIIMCLRTGSNAKIVHSLIAAHDRLYAFTIRYKSLFQAITERRNSR